MYTFCKENHLSQVFGACNTLASKPCLFYTKAALIYWDTSFLLVLGFCATTDTRRWL